MNDVAAVSNVEMQTNAFKISTERIKCLSQKWERIKKDQIEYYYKVYILVNFSKKEYEQYISKYIYSRLQEAQNLFEKAEQMEKDNNNKNAYNYYNSVLNMTQDIINFIPPDQAIDNMNKIKSLSEEANNKKKILEKYNDTPLLQDINRGDLNIKLWTNKIEYTIGDSMQPRLWANKDCYICIVDFGDNSFRVLFPKFNKNNKIGANFHYDFDGGVAESPCGKEIIKIFASTIQFNLPSTDLMPEDFIKKIRENTLSAPSYTEASRILEVIEK